MVSSVFVSHQYLAKDHVESCGAILFDISTPQEMKVCLIRHLKKDEWLLAKGQRNCGESRGVAAIREVIEETGYLCHLYPLRITTRAPSASESADVRDEPRSYQDLTEPFILTTRDFGGKLSIKLIWWYIAALDKDSGKKSQTEEGSFQPQFFPCQEAIRRLTFESDRTVLLEVIRLMEESVAERQAGKRT
ncbi:hypothetical protein GQ43DRAFT_148675 [Delitschia confertaspora ATCC 74209]|uniref:Nudix hydrolase domain-containing protein n=1 Tax=Delitschia confertaspora ATCC 74209 TaxID=1513339 RepID=A0A9P4MMU2_9PLEO|nr:hypothetical protein GQ43DRAFT_148675 [Delitschia confertaspora ATCC 74209]